MYLIFNWGIGDIKKHARKKFNDQSKTKNKKKHHTTTEKDQHHILLKQNEKSLAFVTATWNFSQDSMRLTDTMKHAKGKRWSIKAALLIGLPLCTCSVWPRKIERHSIANWGRGQNKMIIKKHNSSKTKTQYNQLFKIQSVYYKENVLIAPSTKKKFVKASFKWL